MTREEVIEELKGCIIAEERGKDGKPNGNITCELTRDTLDMAIKVLEQEPTTKNDLALIHTEGLDEEIRCTMCTNSMKNDRGCDGSCVVNKDMYKAVMNAIEKRIQSTTKNNLGVDAVSRKDVHDMLENLPIRGEDKWFNWLQKACMRLAKMPSVTPLEPKIGHWIDKHRLFDSCSAECSSCHKRSNGYMHDNGFSLECKYYDFCPKCGARMVDPQESEDKE